MAPVEAPVELRFDIEKYAVEGNTLLAEDVVLGAVVPFAGRQRDFGDVQRALEALEAAYRSRGYSAVQVYLPEQELDKGTVRLRVIEGRIRRLQIEGNRFFDEANVRASLPSIVEGRTPNAHQVSRNLRIVNESPAKQTNVTLRAGEKEGEIDAIVDVTEENPKKWFMTLDNTGNKQSGNHRIGFGFQHANLGGRDQAMTIQYVTSLEKPKTLSVYSVGYHIPLYTLGASMDLVVGYSDSDVGATQTPTGELKFSGRGTVFGARWNQQFHRLGNYDHRLTFALDHKRFENTCTLGVFGAAGCGAAAASFNVTPVTLTYAGTFSAERGFWGFNASVTRNMPGGDKGNTAALAAARFGTQGRYTVYRGGLVFAQAMEGDWQVRARLEGQYTNEVLVSPEAFGIGGMNSVRGFGERQIADDKGYSGSVEVYTPELAGQLGWEGWNLRLLGFFDAGRTFRVNPLPAEIPLLGRRNPGQYKVGTPNATIGIRGTHFGILMCNNDCAGGGGPPPPNGLHVDVADGIITVTNASGTAEFRVGQTGYVQSFSTPAVQVPPERATRASLPPQATRQNVAAGGSGASDNECRIGQ